MSQPQTTYWTLKKQLRTLLILSGLMVVLLSLFGGWRIQQFDKKNQELQQTSLTLQRDLEKNFENARLLTSIRASLRKYMRSAHPEILKEIHSLTETLNISLPEKLKPRLSAFVKKLSVLKIRMDSFRKNNEALNSIEREILQTTEELLNHAPIKFHARIRQLSAQSWLKHHHLYTNVLLTDNQDSLQRTKRGYEQLFAVIEETIKNLNKQLPPSCLPQLKKLQTAYYKLDESVSTILAIRRVTLETQEDVKIQLISLGRLVADESLAQANFLSSLTQSGLTFLKNNLIMMSIIMIIIAALGGVTAFFFNHNMLKPLISFTNMLKKMTRMLSGLRQANEFEENFSPLLESMTAQRNNEIGQVATAVQHLLLRLRELALFRQDIEADESTDEVYRRMARIFSERLHLTSVIIFELSPDEKTMEPVFRRIDMEYIELPSMEEFLTEECRARRNGKMISSFKDSHTCTLFPLPDTLRHVCIPMQISGQIIGLVQFLFPPKEVAEKGEQLTEALIDARHYISEAVPVLHAKRLTVRLQKMATEDPLTGLFNRHYLENSLDLLVAGVVRRKSTIAVLMTDLDHFKRINDTYGHDAGDLVLNQLAKIFINNVRETDLVIRFGGEEFLTLLVDCDMETARIMAERIRTEVENYKFQIPGNIIRITISTGIALFPQSPEQGIRDTFKCSDIAMYRAKEKGRNMVIIYDEAKMKQK